MMTKKLVWRLREQPTSESLQKLVSSGLLTKEEAREILFNSETEEDRDKKSLESEIKFLRELVEKLSQDRSKIVEVIREIKVPYYQYQWYQPYQIWCGSMTTYADSGSLLLNATSTCDIGGATNFSDIKTF